MSFKYGALSFLALCIIVLFGIKNYETWKQPVEIYPKFETGKQAERVTSVSLPIEGGKDNGINQSYRMIAEKNIFSSERKDFPIQAVEGSKTKVRPQVILYGVTIWGEYQAASIQVPSTTHKKGERELVTRKIGDQVGEYKIARIYSDRITLESENDSFDILLYDSKMPKKRTFTKTEMQTTISPSTRSSSQVPTAKEPTSTPESVTPRPTADARPPALPQILREKPTMSPSRDSIQEKVPSSSLPVPTRSSGPIPRMTIETNPSSFPGGPGSPGTPIKPPPDFIPPEGKK